MFTREADLIAERSATQQNRMFTASKARQKYNIRTKKITTRVRSSVRSAKKGPLRCKSGFFSILAYLL